MTHKNEHHLNIIFTGDDYDRVIAYRQAFGLTDSKRWTEHCAGVLRMHMETDLHDLKVKFGGKDE